MLSFPLYGTKQPNKQTVWAAAAITCEIRAPQATPQLQGRIRSKAGSAHVLELGQTATATVWEGADTMGLAQMEAQERRHNRPQKRKRSREGGCGAQ